MRKVSTHVLYFIITLIGLTPELAVAAIDGSAQLISSDTGVLSVETLEDGTFKVTVVGPGEAQLIAQGDADLGEGIKTIQSTFDYTVYEPGPEADHFDLKVSGFVYRDAVTDTTTDTATDPTVTV